MIIFDYIYYRVYYLYLYKWKDDDPKVYSVTLVSLLQAMNLVSLMFLLLFFLDERITVNKLYSISFFLILIALNFYRYRKRNFHYLEKKWMDKNRKSRLLFGYSILIYLVFSTFLFIWSAML